MCLTQAKNEAASVKKDKGQLKMMEDGQNLRKILAKVHRQKRPKYVYPPPPLQKNKKTNKIY